MPIKFAVHCRMYKYNLIINFCTCTERTQYRFN